MSSVVAASSDVVVLQRLLQLRVAGRMLDHRSRPIRECISHVEVMYHLWHADGVSQRMGDTWFHPYRVDVDNTRSVQTENVQHR